MRKTGPSRGEKVPDADTTYDERLWPPIWLWFVGWAFVLSLAASFYAALGPIGGLTVVAVAGGLLSWGLVSSAARVRVRDGELTAGRALIPVQFLGPIEVLDADQARAVRGVESDPAAYHLIRGWVAAGVRAKVIDAADPTPYWFVASRDPVRLALAVAAARPSI